MADYGHDLLFGSFITPSNQQAPAVVALSQLSEQAGLDLVTFQDHPYQPRFLDTWTLMSYVAAQTQTIRLTGNVINLPLRPPAVLARSVASLDLLTGGRVELGLGAGAFREAVEAMGGRRLTPGQAVAALGEAIEIIRMLWDTGTRGGARYNGDHYRLAGAKRGPAPAHDVSIWLGAYKPRMLRLTGGKADGWLPSLGYVQPEELGRGNAVIDEAALAAGREPADVRRLLNVTGTVTPTRQGFLSGPVDQWAEELATLTLEDGISAFILGTDDSRMTQVFGQEIAPAVRELVERERRPPRPDPGGGARDAAGGSQGRATESPSAPGVTTPDGERDIRGTGGTSGTKNDRDASDESITGGGGGNGDGSRTADTAGGGEYERLGVNPTPDDDVRLSEASARLWDEASRPHRQESGPEVTYSATGRRVGQHLIDVHDALRQELAELREVIVKVRDGAMDAGAARSALNEMTMRQNNWTMGAYCAQYCRVVTAHHGLEDDAVFPHLLRRDPSLATVIDRLKAEHRVIHEVINGVDTALVAFMNHPDDFSGLQEAVDILTDTLRSHLAYEERELVEPLARHGLLAGQIAG